MNLKSQRTSEFRQGSGVVRTPGAASDEYFSKQFAEEFRKQIQAEEALRRLQEKPLTFLHRIVPGQISQLSKEAGKENG